MEKWKYNWDVVLNDDSFRRKFLGYPKGYSEVCLSGPIARGRVGKLGTIHMTGTNGEDHFAAYANGIIFDPAGNRYKSFTQEQYASLIKKKFPNFKFSPIKTQVRKGDTFCQTWSLYWLKFPERITSESLYDICNTPGFPEPPSREWVEEILRG